MSNSGIPILRPNFTVRSAYRALLHAQATIEPVGSNESEQSYWARLWRMKVPPKVRNYWWRVIKGFIPCRSVIQKRHIEKIAYCHSCGKDERIKHALFKCTWAKLFWQEIKTVSAVKIPELHPDTWAIDVIDGGKVDGKAAAIILCGGYAVWSERNARKHGENGRTNFESVKWALDTTVDLNTTGCVTSAIVVKLPSKWCRPAGGVLKINVDASFSSTSSEGSSGVVIRNHEGALVRAQAIWYDHAANVLSMEAIAVRDGLKMANDLGLKRVEVETDAKEVVKLWTDRAQGRFEITTILLEIEDLVANMESVIIKFIGREANEKPVRKD